MSYLETKERINKIIKEKIYPSLLDRDRDSSFSKELWSEIGKTGFFKGGLKRENGGYEVSLKDEIDLYYNFAKESKDLPLALSLVAHGAVACELLEAFGTVEQKKTFLKEMSEGSAVAAVSNSEESGGTDIRSIQSKLVMEDAYSGKLEVNKKGASNLGQADIIFNSLWVVEQDLSKSMEVIVTRSSIFEQSTHNPNLSGFKTGLTGSCKTRNEVDVSLEEVRLGEKLNGFKILKHCFNIERLFVASIIAGTLDGILSEAMYFLEKRKSFGIDLKKFQYMQQKVIDIYSAKEIINTFIDSIVNNGDIKSKKDLYKVSNKLSLLKISCIEDGISAARSFFEVFGYIAYTNFHIAQKVLRDLIAFTYLGGTKEQQKIVLFAALEKEYLNE